MVNSTYFLAAVGIEGVLKVIVVIIIFVVILLITRLTTKWIGGVQKKQSVGNNISSIEVFRLANNKYVQIIKIAEEYYAIAVTKDNVTFLGKVNKDDLKLEKETVRDGQSFASVLDFMKSVKDKTTK